MKQLKKTILTLVALLAVTTGAWAQADVTWTYADIYSDLSTKLEAGQAFVKDGIKVEMKIYPNLSPLVEITADNFNVYGGAGYFEFTAPEGKKFSKILLNGGDCYCQWNVAAQISGAPATWEGTEPAAVVTTDPEQTGFDFMLGSPTTFEFYFASSPTGPEVAWNKATKTGTFTMPAGNVELQVEYYPGMLTLGSGAIEGGKLEVVGLGLGTTSFTAPSEWSKNSTILTSGHFEGFKSVTEEEAKAWPGVPATGLVALYYNYDETEQKWDMIYFKDGAFYDIYKGYKQQLSSIYNLSNSNFSVFYTTGMQMPAGFEQDEDGNIYVAKDTKFTVKATPAAGYYLQSWADDDKVTDLEREITMGDDDLTLTPTFAQMPVLTLAQSDATMGTVTIEGAGGAASIGPKEEIKYNNNFVGEYYQVTGGGTNASWRKVGSSDNSTITIESLNGEIINNLTLEVYTTSLWDGYSIATTSGTVSVDPENNAYIYVTDINATSVTLSRTGTGSANGTVGFCMFTVNGIEDAAPAAPANIFPVEGEDGKYYVIPGSQITLKATAAEGYNVAGWKVGTETIATGDGIAYADYQDADKKLMPATSTYTFTMTDAKTIAPVFGENEYNVEFAEGTNTSEWTATPNPAKTKQTVTVTYTGTRKVIGVKAEKKAAAPATVLSGALVDGATIKVYFKWRGENNGNYVQGVYNAASGTFTASKGGDKWGTDGRAIYKVEKSGDNIIIGAGFYAYNDEAMVWTFNTTNDTYTTTNGGFVNDDPESYGLISVTLNGTDITSQLTAQ